MIVGGLAAAELEAKITSYGWNSRGWPMELSFLTDSAGHNAFFLLFIIPVMFAIYLAIARHAPDETE